MTDHLWEHNHPYYATEGCYYTPGTRWDEVHADWSSWADFFADWGDTDLDYNLLYRWDWRRPDPFDYPDEDGIAAPEGELLLFFMLQRKAKPFSHRINVTEADEPAVRAWLTTRAEHLRQVWEPLLDAEAAR